MFIFIKNNLTNNYRKIFIIGFLSVFLIIGIIFSFFRLGILKDKNPQDVCFRNLKNYSTEELYKKLLDFKDSTPVNLEIIKGLFDNFACEFRSFPLHRRDFDLFVNFIKNSGLNRGEADSLLSSAMRFYEERLRAITSFAGALAFYDDSQILCPQQKEEVTLVKKCIEDTYKPKYYDGKIIPYDFKVVSEICNNFCEPILKYQDNKSLFATDLRSYLAKKSHLRRDDFEDTFWLFLLLRYGNKDFQKEFCGYYNDLSEQLACLDTVERVYSQKIINSQASDEKKEGCYSFLNNVKADICQYFPHF